MLPISSPISGLGGGGGLSSSSSATSSARSGDIYEGARSNSFNPVMGAGSRAPTFNLALGDGAKVSSNQDINEPSGTYSRWTLYGLIAASLLVVFFVLKKA